MPETPNEKRARETLIYLNHHACHLVKDSTITKGKLVPTKEDVRDLGKVFDEVQAEERSRIAQRLRARADVLLNDHLMTNPRCRRDELLAAIIEIKKGA